MRYFQTMCPIKTIIGNRNWYAKCWLNYEVFEFAKYEQCKHQTYVLCIAKGEFAKMLKGSVQVLFGTVRSRKTQWSESLHAEKQQHYFCVDWGAEIGSYCATTLYLGFRTWSTYNLHIFQKTYCFWRFGNKSSCCRRKGALNKELIYTFPFLWLFSSWNSRTLHAKELST